ncbi:hypothetical protein GCM10017635_09480 [Paracoccus kondratievae]|uniref:Uncharacterized protein n=1 Tax=Paracoccus kondratievae TaxID=135740 RepID=A0AAD3RSJ5_9RHOB|nr:hypothetical protein GCM10017635_09480 [Paracoccus kondratievae]
MLCKSSYFGRMQKPPLTDLEASDLLCNIWVQLAQAKGQTVHAETALRAATVAIMTLSAALTGAMDKARGD